MKLADLIEIETVPAAHGVPEYSIVHWNDENLEIRFNNMVEGFSANWNPAAHSWDFYLTFEEVKPKLLGGFWHLDSLKDAIHQAYHQEIKSQENVVLFV